MSRRSSVERLPPEVRDDIDQAIADGATIDEIVARIRALGGDCSRSAVGRYAKRVRNLIGRQREVDRFARMWLRELGERPVGQASLLVIEALRAQALLIVADLDEEEAPMAVAEIARLALALRRMESADRLRAERERTLAKAAARSDRAGQRAGLSPHAVAAIRLAIEGRPRPEPAAARPDEDRVVPHDPA